MKIGFVSGREDNIIHLIAPAESRDKGQSTSMLTPLHSSDSSFTVGDDSLFSYSRVHRDLFSSSVFLFIIVNFRAKLIKQCAIILRLNVNNNYFSEISVANMLMSVFTGADSSLQIIAVPSTKEALLARI